VKALIAQGCPGTHSAALVVHSDVAVWLGEEIKQLRRTAERLPARTSENHSVDLLKPSVMRQAEKAQRHNLEAREECTQLLILLFNTSIPLAMALLIPKTRGHLCNQCGNSHRQASSAAISKLRPWQDNWEQ